MEEIIITTVEEFVSDGIFIADSEIDDYNYFSDNDSNCFIDRRIDQSSNIIIHRFKSNINTIGKLMINLSSISLNRIDLKLKFDKDYSHAFTFYLELVTDAVNRYPITPYINFIRGMTNFTCENCSAGKQFKISAENIPITTGATTSTIPLRWNFILVEKVKYEELQKIQKPENMLDLVSAFKNILDSSEFADVHITTNGTKTTAVHKAFLCSRSSVFHEMFSNEMSEKSTNYINIDDIKHEVVEEMLLYIYTGQVKNIDLHAEDLLYAADKYDLKVLKIMCEKALSAKINVDNAVNFLYLSDRHIASHLKQKVLEFFKENVSQIMKTEEWQTMKCHPDLMHELFEFCNT